MSALFSVKRKIRPARPAQKKPTQIGEEGHSWAVSYADFLMVLLSFFVVFFSVDKNERATFIENFLASENLSKTIKHIETPPMGGETVAGSTKKQNELPEAVRSLTERLQGFFVTKKTTDQVIISFEDNIYKLGSFDLETKELHTLHELLIKLEPYMNAINITFIGHTDDNSNFRTGNRYIKNNFDLSSLRATKALQMAVKLGFNPKQMYAQGVAENDRASRTLSLVVSPGGKGP